MACRLLAPLLAATLLAGCMGIDVRSVSRADASDAPAADRAIAVGRIRFVVDGKPLDYHLLNKPALQLFHRGRGVLMATPETSGDGRFAWSLPAGDYGVAVIHGGKTPAQQPHHLPGGGLVFVNGLVDPGLSFRVAAGMRAYVGTIEVQIESAPQKGVVIDFGERVFGRLLAIRVIDELASDAPRAAALQPALMQVSARAPAAEPR